MERENLSPLGGLFPQVEARMEAAEHYDRWRAAFPWRWLPSRAAVALFPWIGVHHG